MSSLLALEQPYSSFSCKIYLNDNFHGVPYLRYFSCHMCPSLPSMGPACWRDQENIDWQGGQFAKFVKVRDLFFNFSFFSRERASDRQNYQLPQDNTLISHITTSNKNTHNIITEDSERGINACIHWSFHCSSWTPLALTTAWNVD